MAGSVRDHIAAVKALIVAALPVTTAVVEGVFGGVQNPPPATVPPPTPYVVVRAGSSTVENDRLGSYSNLMHPQVYVTCVGGTESEALWAAEKVRTALLDQRIAVAGWDTSPLRHLDGGPVTVDTDVAPPVFYVVEVYQLTSTSLGG